MINAQTRIFVILFQVILICFCSSAFADKTVGIVYSGCTLGQMYATPECHDQAFGGLARRASAVNSLREKVESFIFVDIGGVFPTVGSNRKIHAEVCLEIMSLMNYDAMNLGISELAFGIDFLQQQASNMTFPFLTVNLTGENTSSFLKNAIIKNVGDARVAILGAMSIDEFSVQTMKNVKVLSSSAALKNEVSAISKDADFIVLLSQLSQEQLAALLDEIGEIDLVITCRYSNEKADSPPGRTHIVSIRPKGYELGYVKIEKDMAGDVKVIEDKKISLDDSIPENREILELVTQFYRQKLKEERIGRQRRVMENEAQKLMNLSPMEYLESLQKSGK